MAGETIYDPGAITAGTRKSRSFSTLAFQMGLPPQRAFRTRIKIDASRCPAEVLLYRNGDSTPDRVGAGTVATIDPGTPVYVYQLDVASDIAANLLRVYENGGLDEKGDRDDTRFDR